MMTESSNTPSGNSTTFFGVISIVLGLLCMLAPLLTGFAIALLVGILVLAGGIVRIIWAFRSESLGKGALSYVIGALTLLCGIMLVSDPILASGLLTILLAIYFFLDGVFEITAGLLLRPIRGWGWLLFGGFISIVLGALILGQFPLSGAWATGILLGIKLFFVGLIMLTAPPVIPSTEAES